MTILIIAGFGLAAGVYAYESLATRRQLVLPWFTTLVEQHGLTLGTADEDATMAMVAGGRTADAKTAATGMINGSDVVLQVTRALHLKVSVRLDDFPYTVAERDHDGLRPRLHGTDADHDELERLSFEGPELRREWMMYATSKATVQAGVLGEVTHRWDARRCLARLLRTARLVQEARALTRDERLLGIVMAHEAADVCVDIARAVARDEPNGALARWWRERLSDTGPPERSDEPAGPVERAIGSIALERPPTTVEELEAVVAHAYLAFDGDRFVAVAWLELAGEDRVLQLGVLGSDLPDEVIALALTQLEATGRLADLPYIRERATFELAPHFQQTVEAITARAGRVAGGQLSVAQVEGGGLSEPESSLEVV